MTHAEDLTVDNLPFTVKETNVPWSFSEKIFTFRGEIIDVTFTQYFVSNATILGYNFDMRFPGEIVDSQKEFYIDGVKKDFNEYLKITGNDSIKTTKQIEFSKGFHTVNFKLSIKSNNFAFKQTDRGSRYEIGYNVEFSEGGKGYSSYVFERQTYRVPVPTSKNIKIDIQQSTLENNSEKFSYFVANPKISISDKYVDITYDFLIQDARVIEKYPSTKISPGLTLAFHSIFLIENETVRLDWVLQAIIGAILLTLAFYGGTRWERKIGEKTLRKKPPE